MVKNYFPFSTMRNGQKETLEQLQEAYDCDYQYFLLDAPVGSGKSAIARALCNYLHNEEGKDSYILTPTLQLQEQYEKDTRDDKYCTYHVGKGRSNFLCEYEENTLTCDDGRCVWDYKHFKSKKCNNCAYEYTCEKSCEDVKGCSKCPVRMSELCSYYNNKEDTKKADVGIMNYNLLLVDKTYNSRFNMVCDEAHNIENKLMQMVDFKVSEKQVNKYNIYSDFNFTEHYEDKDIESHKEYLELITDALTDSLTELMEEINESLYESEREELNKKAFKVTTLINKLEKGLYNLRTSKVPWFVIPDKKRRSFEYKPLNVSEFAEQYLFNKSEFHLLMSGTIIDKQKYCECLGLDTDEVYYHKQPTSFDIKKNNPLILNYAGSMSFFTKKKTLPRLCELVKQLLDKHETDKGIIHCWSQGLAKQIQTRVKSDRFICYKNSKEKEEKLEEFKENDTNAVLLGYSLEEGVDLPYNHIRFQMLLKAPYAYLGDEQIRARKNLDSEWYTLEAMRQLIQMQGRGMRYEDDFCVNYVLDAGFDRILNHHLLPDEVRNSIIR